MKADKKNSIGRVLLLLGIGMLTFAGCQPKSEPTDRVSDTTPVVQVTELDRPVDEGTEFTESTLPPVSEAKVTPINGEEEFEQFIASAPVTVVDFTATWCPPCQQLAPELDKMAANLAKENVRFCKVDFDKNGALAKKLGIQGIPDVRVFLDGKEFAKTVGAIPAEIKMNIAKALSANDETKKSSSAP